MDRIRTWKYYQMKVREKKKEVRLVISRTMTSFSGKKKVYSEQKIKSLAIMKGKKGKSLMMIPNGTRNRGHII